ncbi:MAG: hypothetical protein Q9160_002451 [Pyrenula sp. 1 TL-2023]
MDVSSRADHSLQEARALLLRSQSHVFSNQSTPSLPRLEHLRDAHPHGSGSKRNYYASPPSSPARGLSPISFQAAQEVLRLGRGGMDGDNRHHQRQYAPTGYQAPSGVSPVTAQQGTGAQTDRYQQAMQMHGRTDPASAMGRSNPMPEYGNYAYGNQSAYNTPSMPTGSLQGSGMQFPPDYSQDPTRQQQQQQAQQHQQQPQQQPRHHNPQQQQQPSSATQAQPPQTQQQFPQYGSNMVYNIPQQATPQSPYNTVQPSYHQQRQSTAIDVLSNQFGMQPYFGQNEPTSVSAPTMSATNPSYITSQVDTGSYTQQTQTPVARAAVSQAYPMEMEGYETTTAAATADPGAQQVGGAAGAEQESAQQDPTYDEAYNQYQKALKETFEHTNAGRLVKASESLLRISSWLLGHAVELGLVRDNEALYDERLKMWNEFNLCWLGVAQKQKDLLEEDLLQQTQTTRRLQYQHHQHQHQHRELLSTEMIEKLCDEVVALGDKMEPHGLVDYQMGFWEEEVLSGEYFSPSHFFFNRICWCV